jgi:hypothetical protein
MTDPDLNQKLDALGAKLAAARAHLQQEAELFHEIDHLTGRQLQERYELLKAKLDEDVGELEAQGLHVTNFEKSVLGWIESLDA